MRSKAVLAIIMLVCVSLVAASPSVKERRQMTPNGPPSPGVLQTIKEFKKWAQCMTDCIVSIVEQGARMGGPSQYEYWRDNWKSASGSVHSLVFISFHLPLPSPPLHLFFFSQCFLFLALLFLALLFSTTTRISWRGGRIFGPSSVAGKTDFQQIYTTVVYSRQVHAVIHRTEVGTVSWVIGESESRRRLGTS